MKIRNLFILMSVLIISACGFHLRGSGLGALDIPSIYVTSDGAPKLAEEVTQQLKNSGVTITDTADDAEYVLKLSNESQKRRVLTVSPDTGKVEEYELSYIATMTVSTPDGTELAKDQTVRAKRDLYFDEDAVLGKFEEARLVETELLREAANAALRRLRAAVK